MKTIIVVHIALNARGERVGCLVVACGRIMPLGHHPSGLGLNRWRERSSEKWIEMDLNTESSVKAWKCRLHVTKNAVRFQRVTLIGESK